MNNNQVKKTKLIINIISIIVFLLISLIVLIVIFPKLEIYINDPLLFKEFINEYGTISSIIFLVLQILQIIVSILPGEFIEIGAGITFGWFKGFILCEIGLFIGTAFIYFFSKKVGKPVVKAFIGERHFSKLEKLDNHPNRDKVLFIIFLIPGLPKDLISYVACFFNIGFWKFIFISLVARIPSVITSTIAGGYIIDGKYIEAIIVFIITGIISILCYLLSNKIMQKINENKINKNDIE